MPTTTRHRGISVNDAEAPRRNISVNDAKAPEAGFYFRFNFFFPLSLLRYTMPTHSAAGELSGHAADAPARGEKGRSQIDDTNARGELERSR